MKHGVTELTTARSCASRRRSSSRSATSSSTSAATRKPRRRPRSAIANKHRALIDAEYALNSDGGGGTLDDDTGKPLFFGLQTAEKTYADFTLTARNPGGHSSQPRADNAIYDLAAALVKLREFSFPVMWNDTTVASFRAGGQDHAG